MTERVGNERRVTIDGTEYERESTGRWVAIVGTHGDRQYLDDAWVSINELADTIATQQAKLRAKAVALGVAIKQRDDARAQILRPEDEAAADRNKPYGGLPPFVYFAISNAIEMAHNETWKQRKAHPETVVIDYADILERATLAALRASAGGAQ